MFVSWRLVSRAISRCSCQGCRLECCLRFKLWLLVPLPGCVCRAPLHACVRVVFALWNFVGGAAGWCRWGVPLHGAAATCLWHTVVCDLRMSWWSRWRVPLQGSAVRVVCGRRCRVPLLLSECCLRFGAWCLVQTRGPAVPLQGAVSTCCCQRAVCALVQ